ncbi:WD40 repeat domain-containing protein [Synechocystis sp. PCC 7509]|uniref:WD40 repeat domain-containing protein n=1 Tax=Synechocystis sp. PCC 7509 TaxID=927677 RepID=UPI0002AC3BFF|nr:hypothetical protein [Synechocystis sp. PCC 7509]
MAIINNWQNIQSQSLNGHTKGIWFVAISPDNKTFATASDDNTVKLWNSQTGGLPRTLTGHIPKKLVVNGNL